MRITYVADAPRLGGAERYLATVAEAASGAGHAVRVVAPQSDVLDLVRTAVPAAELVQAGSDAYAEAPDPARRVARLLTASRSVVAAVGRGRPTIVHLNNGGYPGSDLVRLAAIAAVVPPAARRVMSIHSVPWDRSDGGVRTQGLVDRALWPRLGTVVGATLVVGDRLAGLRGLPAGKYRRIPYGVEAPGGADAAAGVRAQLASPGELLVGMVSATADPGKGHAVLAEAVRRVDGVCAVIIGADPGADFRGLLDATGIADRVTVAGRVPDVGPYLHAMDVLVVPSVEFESLPLVILEAMGASKPVFGSRLAGIPEAIEDGVTGAVFEPGDAAALAALLAGAHAARQVLETQGRAGRATWEQRFSREAMTSAVLALYEELPGVH